MSVRCNTTFAVFHPNLELEMYFKYISYLVRKGFLNVLLIPEYFMHNNLMIFTSHFSNFSKIHCYSLIPNCESSLKNIHLGVGSPKVCCQLTRSHNIEENWLSTRSCQISNHRSSDRHGGEKLHVKSMTWVTGMIITQDRVVILRYFYWNMK